MPDQLTSLADVALFLELEAGRDRDLVDNGWTYRARRLWQQVTPAADTIRDPFAGLSSLVAGASNWPPSGPLRTRWLYDPIPYLVPPATVGPRNLYTAPRPVDLDTVDARELGTSTVAATALAVLADAVRARLSEPTNVSRRDRARLAGEAARYADVRDAATPLAVENARYLRDALAAADRPRLEPATSRPIRLRTHP